MIKPSTGRTVFLVCNYVFLTLLAFLCLLPIVNVFSVSLSAASASEAGLVRLWPVRFTWKSYEYVLGSNAFLQAMLISFKRVLLGSSISLLLTVLIAYPLSKEVNVFRWRTAYAWFFVITILFSGGLIPLYMVVKALGLMDTIWSLVLPSAVPVFLVILMLNFFRSLPKELEEAALVDGASHWRTMTSIYVPLSLPGLATCTLFSMVGHWNAWFDGLIFMNSTEHYPLQSYLQTVIVQSNLDVLNQVDLLLMQYVSDRSVKAAQIFIGALPILIVYPFLQRYFVKGIVVGSVKQ
ncbi:carbohydrate ABC transporter permease [Paenibacillus sp. HJGM_3]|uniref:carbohydrate ABC transporter permease n=1 Tax=Paenibacillus sp. HJGM_3 TaxID=3379816 RepID=UPI00385F4B5E